MNGFVTAISPCTPSAIYAYQKALAEWNVCQACGRQGLGTQRTTDGQLVCGTTQVPGALASCPAGPTSMPCFPFASGVDPNIAWDDDTPGRSRSWGAAVFDPQLNATILYGTYNPETGLPYLAQSAPYELAGRNVACPAMTLQ